MTVAELNVIELGPLVAHYWNACDQWPRLTLRAACANAGYKRPA